MHRRGFTLVELVLVISILAALAVVIFASLNPGKRIHDSKTITTEANRQQIAKVISLKIADSLATGFSGCASGNLPAFPTIMASPNNGGYNIMPCLTEYFSKMPVNTLANGYFNNASDYNTQFYVERNPVTGKVTVGKSYDIALTPVTSAGSRRWETASISSDGTKMLAATNDSGGIYVSTDSGSTWVNPQTGLGYTSSSMSSDGNIMVVAKPAGSFPGMYVSTNSGQVGSWTQGLNASPGSWISVASSSNGTKMIAASQNGYVYISSNSGSSWTQINSYPMFVNTWRSVAISADGLTMFAFADNDFPYRSTDSGATWTQVGLIKNWYKVTCSSDCTKLAAIVNQEIHLSSDSGATWTRMTSLPMLSYWALDMSSDGNRIIIGGVDVESSAIFTTSNFGNTWIHHSYLPSGVWHAIATSDDGRRVVAGQYNGSLYFGEYSLRE